MILISDPRCGHLTLAERPSVASGLLAALFGNVAQSLFDPETWPPQRQVDAVNEALSRIAEPNPDEGLLPVPIDAILELWFEHRPAARLFFAEPSLSRLAEWEDASVDTALTKAVVAKVKVVHDEFSFQRSVTQPFLFNWQEPEGAGQ